MATGASWRERGRTLTAADGLPPRDPLPRYVAPVPEWLENLGLNLVWLVVAINLLGTFFGFYFYAFRTGQLPATPVVMWPWVPDSPLATLFAAAAFAAYGLGRPREWLSALAFYGNLVLGFWTPYTLVVFRESYAWMHPAMYNFLFWSHLAMVVQAFVIHRFSDFPVRAVGVALAWYASDLLVDYHVPVVGEPHHTSLPVARDAPMWLGATAIDAMAAGAAILTLLATFLALATRAEKLGLRVDGGETRRQDRRE